MRLNHNNHDDLLNGPNPKNANICETASVTIRSKTYQVTVRLYTHDR